jgi:hypothetical protein
MTGRSWLMLASLAFTGCSARQPVPPPAGPVPVQGTTADLRRLAGSWLGEFVSDQGERRGTIAFTLATGSDTAFGSVTLRTTPAPVECVDPARPVAVSEVVAPIVLRLGALATRAGSVGGWLRPYRDPEAACWADTWFEGSLLRDTLTGTWFTRLPGKARLRTGQWWVAKVTS